MERFVCVVDYGRSAFCARFGGALVSVRVREGLQLEELLAEEAGVDCEGAGGGRARGEGFGEEFVVALGPEGFFAGSGVLVCGCGCVSL